MQGRTGTTITCEGAIFPADFLRRIIDKDLQIKGLSAEAYHLTDEKLNEAINRSWVHLLQKWHALSKLPEPEYSRALKEGWLFPLFRELGYGHLLAAKPFEKEGKKYPISHGWGHVPIHLVDAHTGLDDHSYKVRGSSVRQSPHTLVQELLNHSDEHIWGIVTNGLRLRLLRRNKRLVHRTYIDFELEAMMQGEVYADFALFWLLCHQSRVEHERPEECWLEVWLRQAREQGIRALEKLRAGVEGALRLLGQGFLDCRTNQRLREKLRSGSLSARDYYHQLLRLIYRLIVLFVAEDRDLLLIPDAPEQAKDRYIRYYSMARLRRLAGQRYGSHHTDIFQGLRLIMRKLSSDPGCPDLALPALDGFLFERDAIPDLENCDIANAYLLEAIRSLAFLLQEGGLQPIDYQHIGSEELGSVYESLLEYHPVVEGETPTFRLQMAPGNERKTTASYYTPPALVECLLNSTLEPVLAQACQQPDPERALLNLKVCDPACGSGHFLIAAAHRIAYRLAFERAGKAEPDRETWCRALRDVIRNCIYGVDSNSMAVELCKVSLCIEAIEPGKPLVFLDYRIRCGNSLIGATPALLRKGIPDSAFERLEGDDPKLCREYRQRNRAGRAGQWHLLIEPMDELIGEWKKLQKEDDSSYAAVQHIKKHHEELTAQQNYRNNVLIADAWCAAFFWRKVSLDSKNLAYPFTQGILRELIEHRQTYQAMREEIERLAKQHQFFHWHLEFPDVFHDPSKGEAAQNEQAGWSGGFDVVLGNPPWERIKIQEKEWFATRRPDIANAANAAQRRKQIAALAYEDPRLYADFMEDQRKAGGESHFARHSGRYPLCGRGDVNIYSIFAEHMRHIVHASGRVGCIVPSGIATDDTTKVFFQDITTSRSLVSLYDFDNLAGLFPSVDSRFKFCLLTLAGAARSVQAGATFAFFLHQTAELQAAERRFTLSTTDIALLNPNTRTCPIFRSKRDMELTKAIYERVPILIKEGPPEENPWGIKFSTMFHMTNDSHLFRSYEQLEKDGWKPEGNTFSKGEEHYLPLYEAKMIGHFDHRFGTHEGQALAQANQGKLPELTEQQHADPFLLSMPGNWIHESHMPDLLQSGRKAFLVFRDIARSTDMRTAIFSIIPALPCSNKLPIVVFHPNLNREITYLASCVSSFVFDYVTRQKAGNVSMNFFIVKQLPVLPPERYKIACEWDDGYLLGEWIVPRALELTYTAWDLHAFARECGYDGPPFRWDDERRFLLRCELDAAYFHLYGIARPDVDYIMDTFRVWKEKEEKQLGGYRTKRVILAIYDEMARAMQAGEAYRTRLEPPPADPAVAHADRPIGADQAV